MDLFIETKDVANNILYVSFHFLRLHLHTCISKDNWAGKPTRRMSLARRDQREVPGAKRVKRRRARRQRGEENMLVAATLAKLGLAQFHMILYRNSRYADIKSCTQVIGEESEG